MAMAWYRKNLSPARQLAHTAAVEHFTALMAEKYLLNSDELAKMDPRAWQAFGHGTPLKKPNTKPLPLMFIKLRLMMNGYVAHKWPFVR
jgi:hypothetical protein